MLIEDGYFTVNEINELSWEEFYFWALTRDKLKKEQQKAVN